MLNDKQVMPTYWVYFLRVYGELLDGPLTGKLANLYDLSNRRQRDVLESPPSGHEVDGTLLYPNPVFLRTGQTGPAEPMGPKSNRSEPAG
jgi:hypothetical protein